MGTKRPAASMEGDYDEEEPVLREAEAEADADDEGEELAGRELVRQVGDEDIDEDDDLIEDDGESQQQQEQQQQEQNQETQQEQHEEEGEDPEQPTNHTITNKKGSLKKKGIASDDEEEKAGPSGKPEKTKEDEEDDEENLDIELGKSQTVDTERMQTILAQFTTEQMSRYECYRRSGFQKANMRRLLQSVAGCAISMPMTIVMSGIAKMFVGELVETARIVMTERRETGPTRPCHIREAYRRLKLKGKVPLRTRPRLFH